MIDNLISNSKIEKAFLFDVISKIYIATDSNPVEMKHYEICSELIDDAEQDSGTTDEDYDIR